MLNPILFAPFLALATSPDPLVSAVPRALPPSAWTSAQEGAPAAPPATTPNQATTPKQAGTPAPAKPASTAKPAPTFSYTYLQVGYVAIDADGFSGRSSGYDARASVGVGPAQFFVDYASDDADLNGGGTLDTDTFGLGLGTHWSVSPKLDLVWDIEWLYTDIESTAGFNFSGSDNGWASLLGARWMALPFTKGGLELNGGYNYVDRGGGGESGLVVGGRLHFLERLSAGLEYRYLENSSSYGLNLRYSM